MSNNAPVGSREIADLLAEGRRLLDLGATASAADRRAYLQHKADVLARIAAEAARFAAQAQKEAEQS